MDNRPTPNRLIDETSPYLLQHAYNPVDWRPWGPEALELAKASGRPILLSVGYAACNWCHVMEKESFEDPATAECRTMPAAALATTAVDYVLPLERIGVHLVTLVEGTRA